MYPGLSSINCIQEKDRSSIWVGTSRGLYLLDKESGNSRNIDLPVESAHVCALYQAENGVLYIGTEGAGLLLYDPGANAFAQYHKENCALGICCFVQKMGLSIFLLRTCLLVTGPVNRGL